MLDLRRRQLITLLGGAAAWPLTANAQQPSIPVIGFLNSGSPGERTHLVAAFHQGLGETAHVDGRNVTIEYRWAQGRYDRLPALAEELVRQSAVIAATGDTVSPRAAKAATTTIPIVFVMGGDPVAAGLVPSFNRPGGNITGVSLVASALAEFVAKQLEFLHELAPKAVVVGILLNPKPSSGVDLSQLQTAARSKGLELVVLRANTDSGIEAAFATLVQKHAECDRPRRFLFGSTATDRCIGGPPCHPSCLFSTRVRRHRRPDELRNESCGAYRQAGIYVGRVLKGEKPADLPVLQPTKFELVINLKVAKALGLKVPLTLQVAADEVIE
jgi:putative tryptophan/tyrosine transport system substrate-binding protein